MPNTNDEQRLMAAANLASRSLADFCIAMDAKWVPAWFHEDICKTLEKVESGEITRLIITMPPRHGKSLLASVYFPAWFLGRQPDAQVITTSYSAELAQDFGGKAKDVVGNDAYQMVFPKAKLRKDTQAKDKWAFTKGGSYTAVGVGGPITGRGADLLLLDDVFKNREEADSKLIRDKIFSWYTSTAYTRLMPGGRIVMLMTRWSNDDLIGRLLKDPTEPWTVLNFPAIAIQDGDGVDTRKKGEALWPEKYPLHVLDRTRAALGPMDWGALYQQSPMLNEFQEFKPEYIKTYDPTKKGFDNGQYNIYCGVDLAISKKDSADYTSIVTYARDRFTGDAYLLDVIRERLDPLETIEAIFHVHAKYRPSKIGIETTAYQASIIYYMDSEMKRRKIFPFIVPITHSTNKEARIRRIQPYYRTGQVFHSKIETEGSRALLEEMFQFPKGGHDDCCLTSHTCILTENGEMPICQIRPGMKVMTRKGFRRVLWSGPTGFKHVIQNLGITGTPDHPIITTSGIKDLSDVTASDTLYIWNEKLKSIEERSITVIQNQIDGNLESIFGDTINGKQVQSLSTDKSTKTSSGLFQKDLLFIIKMKILSTIGSLIWSVRRMVNIFLNITKTQNIWHVSESLPKLEESLQKNGTSLPPVENGIQKKPKNNGRIVSWFHVFVCFVKILFSRVTKHQSSVPGVFVEDDSKMLCERVYNLKIEGEHEFFANSILVHNCDAAATAFELFETTEEKPKERGMNLFGVDPYAANPDYGGGMDQGEGPPQAWQL